MTMQYVRDCYQVPAKRGMSVSINGVGHGRITGACHHLHVLIDGEKRPRRYHPTDPNLKYIVIRKAR